MFDLDFFFYIKNRKNITINQCLQMQTTSSVHLCSKNVLKAYKNRLKLKSALQKRFLQTWRKFSRGETVGDWTYCVILTGHQKQTNAFCIFEFTFFFDVLNLLWSCCHTVWVKLRPNHLILFVQTLTRRVWELSHFCVSVEICR